MVIVVLYGNGDTLLCNPDCATISLLTYIRRATGQAPDSHIDLAAETGVVMGLDGKIMETATQFVGDIRTFILVERIDKSPTDADYDANFPFVYEPKLKNLDQIYPVVREFGTQAMLDAFAAKRALNVNSKKTKNLRAGSRGRRSPKSSGTSLASNSHSNTNASVASSKKGSRNKR